MSFQIRGILVGNLVLGKGSTLTPIIFPYHANEGLEQVTSP